jgi:hypothetical protein
VTRSTHCENEASTPEYKVPVEARLIKYLRLWRDDPHTITANGQTVEQEIADLLEPYIDECLSYGPNDLRGWFSDGVAYLEVAQVALEIFKLVGVTWIEYDSLAPFEFEIQLRPTDDSHFAKTIFRIGQRDKLGRRMLANSGVAARLLVESRPRSNSEWAMAVELTPP